MFLLEKEEEMSVKEHARRLSAKMKNAMKKGEKDLGERHPDHKIFEVQPYSIKSMFLWLLTAILVVTFLVSFLDYSFKSERAKEAYNYYHMLLITWIICLVCSLPNRDQHYPAKYLAKPMTIFVLFLLHRKIQIIGTCCVFSYLALFHIVSLTPVLPICAAVTAVICALITYFGSHHRLFTYDPFTYNKEYKLTRRVDKSAGNLEILVSRPFKIVIKNVGIEYWKSQPGYVVKRQVTVNRRRTETLIPIPKDLIVQSNQKITLVPETEPEQEGVVKIRHFRCFGYDVGNTVLTTIGHRNPNIKKKLAHLEEQFQDLTAPTEWTRVVEMVNTVAGAETIDIL